MYLLVKLFGSEMIANVLYLSDVPGLFPICPPPSQYSTTPIIPLILLDEHLSIHFASSDSEGKTDVTGGMEGKIKECAEILKLSCTVHLSWLDLSDSSLLLSYFLKESTHFPGTILMLNSSQKKKIK